MPGLALLSWGLIAVMLTNADTSGAHPRLYFARHDLPRLASLGWATPQYLAETSFAITYFGDTEVVFPLPPQQPGPLENPPGFDHQLGRYPYWTGMSRQIQTRLESLALSYAASADREYARRAVDYMLALAGWTTWSDPDYSSRTCLDTCHLTMGVAFAYDACFDAMSPEEREQIRDALCRLGLDELDQDASQRLEHNLQMLRNAALGIGGLAILPERPQAWDYLDTAKDFLRWWLDLRDTSPNTEGLAYASYGLGNCLLFGAALAQAESDRSIIAHPYVARAVRWALYFWGPRASGLVNFCDSSIDHPFDVTMRVANKYLNNPYAGYYLKQTGLLARQDFTAAILNHPSTAIAWPPPWPSSAAFTNIGWAALRSGWGDDDLLLAFISSSSKEGHCQFDANSFVVNCAGEWLAADSGYGSFKGGALTEFSDGTAGHNSVLIGGVGQKEKAGAVTDFFTSPMFDYLVGDASRCYDPQVLWRFLRRIAFVHPHFFVMLDELESPEPKRFEFLLHADQDGQYAIEGKAAKSGQAVSGSRVSLVKPGAQLDVRFLEPAAVQLTLDHFKGTKDDYPPYITARDARPRESQRFLTTLVTSRKPESDWILKLEDHAPTLTASVSNSAVEPQVTRLDSFGALLFRATRPGDALTYSLPVPRDGRYRVVAHFLRSPACGDWQVRVDGADTGAPFTGYAPDVRTHQEWDLGEMRLSGGRHEFTFAVTGNHELSSGYFVGVDDVELRPLDGSKAPPVPGPVRLRRLAGEGWVGVACWLPAEAAAPAPAPKRGRQRRRQAASSDGTRCRVYFRLTGADEISDKDIQTDAEATVILNRRPDTPDVAAYRVTRFGLGERQLLQASAPVNFCLVPGDTWSLTLEAAATTDVVFYLSGRPQRPGIPPSLARGVRYDPTAPALRIRLRPGSHTLTWSMR
jgi:hypothetical protein